MKSLLITSILLISFNSVLSQVQLGNAFFVTPEKQFVEWVDATAIRLDSTWEKTDPITLSFLDSSLIGKRIVYLGVTDHYISENYEYALLCTKFLVSRGWTWIAMEGTGCNEKWIDRYLETGDSTFLGMAFDTSSMRTDRDDSPKGVLDYMNRDWHKQDMSDFVEFLQELGKLNATRPDGRDRIHFCGFDVDGEPGDVYSEIDSVIGSFSSSRSLKTLVKRLKRVKGETILQERKRVIAAQIYFLTDSLHIKGVVGFSRFIQIKDLLTSLLESLDFLRYTAGGDMSTNQLMDAFARREQCMFRKMKGLLDGQAKNEKMILLGHNWHLSKDCASIYMFGQNTTLWPSIGSFVDSLLPDQVFAIWMTYDKGWHYAPECGFDSCYVEARMDQIEYLLSKAGGSAFLLPLASPDARSSYLDLPRVFGGGNFLGEGKIRANSDLLFFVREVSPSGSK